MAKGVSKVAHNAPEISRRAWEALIDEWILSERDRAIMKRRLLDGICFEPLAEEFGLSVSRTKEVVKTCQKKLFRHVDKYL